MGHGAWVPGERALDSSRWLGTWANVQERREGGGRREGRRDFLISEGFVTDSASHPAVVPSSAARAKSFRI